MHNGILVRGLRSSIDFQYEQNIDWVNKNIENKVETLYIMSNPNDVVFSSSNVRELIKLNLNISKFLCNEKAEEYINSIYHHMIAG
jgi:pantetheine-phosphate adenylyltransferase